MAFEGLREQLKEQWADLSAKIQESPSYNNIRERFESQTPTAQKLILGGIGALIALLLLSFPLGYLNQASEYLSYTDENRELIHGLLKSARSAKAPAPLPPPTAPEVLRGRLDGMLRANRLLPEQVGDVQVLPRPVPPELVPATIEQSAIAMQLKKLNLTQIIAIANSVNNLGDGIKLIGLDVVQSQGQTHYYDMIIKVGAFGISVAEAKAEPPKPGNRRRRGN